MIRPGCEYLRLTRGNVGLPWRGSGQAHGPMRLGDLLRRLAAHGWRLDCITAIEPVALAGPVAVVLYRARRPEGE